MRTLAAALVALAASAARAEAPITLDEALALAARDNPDLAIARADADIAGADLYTSYAGFLPRLDLFARFGHDYIGEQQQSTSEGLKFSTPATDQEDYSASVQLQQPIFTGLRSLRTVQAASANFRGFGRLYDETRLSVAYDVTSRFHELVRAERSLAVLEKTVARSEDLVARSDALFNAGRAPKADTLQARVNLGNDRIAAEAQRIRVEQARSALATALGRAGPQGLEVVAPTELDRQPAAGEPPPLDALIAVAVARRPVIGAQRDFVEAADRNVGAAQGDYYPQVLAQGTYNRQGPVLGGSFGVYGDINHQYYATAAVLVSWNLFNGRQTSGAVQRARVTARRARATADKTEQGIAKEVADAREAVVRLAREVTLTADNLATAEQGLVLARQRLEAGLASQLEIRDASLKLTQAELALVQARIDHAIAVADLNRAVGGAR